MSRIEIIQLDVRAYLEIQPQFQYNKITRIQGDAADGGSSFDRGRTKDRNLRLIQRPFRNIPEGSIFNRRFFQ